MKYHLEYREQFGQPWRRSLVEASNIVEAKTMLDEMLNSGGEWRIVDDKGRVIT